MLGWFLVLIVLLCIAGCITFCILAKKQADKNSIKWKDTVMVRIAFVLFFLGAIFCVITGFLYSHDMEGHADPRITEELVFVEDLTLVPMVTDENKPTSKQKFSYYVSEDGKTTQFRYDMGDNDWTDISMSSELVTIDYASGEPKLERWDLIEKTTTTYDETLLKYFRPFWRDPLPIYAQVDKEIKQTTYAASIPEDSQILNEIPAIPTAETETPKEAK